MCVALSPSWACQRESRPADERDSPVVEGLPPAQEHPRADGPPVKDGVALLAIDAQLVRFDGRVATPLASAPSGQIHELSLGPGGPELLDGRALLELRADGLRELVSFPEHLTPIHHVARDADGQLWVSGPKGVGVPVGENSWELTPASALGFADDTVVSVALDHEEQGTMWIVGPTRAVYHLADWPMQGWKEGEGQGWVAATVEWLGEGATLLNATPSPVGRVHVNNVNKVTRLGWRNFDSVIVDPKRALIYTMLALAPDGHAGVATSSCELGRVTPRPPTKIWRMAAAEFPCEHAEAIALDAQLRFWVAAREGLFVIDDDRTVHEFPAGSIAGLDGHVSHLVVLGEGPKL